MAIFTLWIGSFFFWRIFYFPVIDHNWSVGMVSQDTAKIWVHSKGDKNIFIDFYKEGNNSHQSSDTVALTKDNEWSHVFLLKDLEPNTRYIYQIMSNVPLPEISTGKFKTFPLSGQPVDLEFNYGSCIEPTLWGKLDFFQYWIENQTLDFTLLLGDTIYTDLFGDISHEQAYNQLLIDPYFSRYIRNIPNFWMYDDHEIINDYDQGEANGYYQHSLYWWKYFFGNKNPTIIQGTDVNYFHYEFGNIGFFVLDIRRYRSANTDVDTEKKTMLGSKQKEVLFNWLKDNANSKIFKFIASPVPLTAKLNLSDGWRSFLTEREQIIDFIQDHNISGVVFISADVHFPIITEIRSNWLIDYSASPLYSFPLEPSISLEETSYIQLSNHKIVQDNLLYINSLFTSGYGYYFGNFKVHTTETDGYYEFSLFAYNLFNCKPFAIYTHHRTLSDTLPNPTKQPTTLSQKIGKTEL